MNLRGGDRVPEEMNTDVEARVPPAENPLGPLRAEQFPVDEKPEDRPAELPQEPAPVLEEDPQRLGDRQDHLAVRDVEEQGLPYPFAPLLQAFGMTRRAEAAGLAGER